MAVSSVGASSGAVQQQQLQFSAARVSQQQQAPQPRESSDSEYAARAQETQPAPRPAEQTRSQTAERVERQEPPKPVVNAQGQKTGTIINTTA